MADVYVSKQTLRRLIEAGSAMQIIDVRKQAAFADSTQMLPNAKWRDHGDVAGWSSGIDPAELVIVYCVHGHEVSQGAGSELRALGFDARYLEGGIEDWFEAGYPTASKTRGTA